MELDRLHLMLGSDLDDLTITTTPAADTNFPADNMQKSARGKFFRYTGTSSVIKASVGESDPSLYANGLAVGRHNLKNSSTVRLRLYDAINQGGNVVYDSTALGVNTIIPWGAFRAGIDPWGASYEDTSNIPKIFSLWFTAIAYKSIQIDVSATDNTTIDIGRLFLGFAFIPKSNFSWGSEFEWVDPSLQTRTAAGGLKTEKRDPYRRFTFDLDWVEDTERERLSHELEKTGRSGDVFIALNPNATGRLKLEKTMIAKRISNNKFARNFHNNQTQQLVFEEA